MIRLKTLLEAKKTGEKITREAFVYLDPKGDKKEFAQCSTCHHFTGTGCTLLGKTAVAATMSCNFYLPGDTSPDKEGKEKERLTPKQVGLVDRKVRCENCRSFENGTCLLYQALNQSHRNIFNLDEKVDPQGCCNAQMPK